VDVGLESGIGVFFGAVLTACIGGVAALIALLAALTLRLQPGDRRSLRVLRFVAGPLACVLVGGLSYMTLISGNPSLGGQHALDVLDGYWFLYPILGVAVGAALSLAIALKRRARTS
jgi:hypothetical protein